MYLYQLNNKDKLREISENSFKKEKEIQQICEKNLKEILGLRFISSEFNISNFRIDTLAYDEQTNSFVIIEYKNTKSFSVIDQGYAYLSLMLNNKADFILEYNENNEKNLKRSDVDWSQSKIIFISPRFTTYQKQSINFKDLPIELWEIKRYKNDILHFDHIKPAQVSDSINTISKQSETIEKVSKEIRVFTEEDHLANKPYDIVELYQLLKESILNVGDNISIKPTKLYIAFTKDQRNIADIHLLKKGLKLWINLKSDELNDPAGVARNVENIGHWGNGDYEIQITEEENIEYIMTLVKQSYEKNK